MKPKNKPCLFHIMNKALVFFCTYLSIFVQDSRQYMVSPQN